MSFQISSNPVEQMSEYGIHGAEAMVQTRHVQDFQASRWGGVAQMKHIAFPLESCGKNEFSPFHAAGEAQKKASRAAWECKH